MLFATRELEDARLEITAGRDKRMELTTLCVSLQCSGKALDPLRVHSVSTTSPLSLGLR